MTHFKQLHMGAVFIVFIAQVLLATGGVLAILSLALNSWLSYQQGLGDGSYPVNLGFWKICSDPEQGDGVCVNMDQCTDLALFVHGRWICLGGGVVSGIAVLMVLFVPCIFWNYIDQWAILLMAGLAAISALTMTAVTVWFTFFAYNNRGQLDDIVLQARRGWVTENYNGFDNAWYFGISSACIMGLAAILHVIGHCVAKRVPPRRRPRGERERLVNNGNV